MTEVSAGTLTDFLLRRIAEDEAEQANTDGGSPWHRYWCGAVSDMGFDCDCGLPARVFAECEAKRQIIARCDDSRRPHHFPTPVPDAELIAWKCAACDQWVKEGSAGAEDCPVDWRPPQPILALLALPYADHAEFNPAWRT